MLNPSRISLQVNLDLGAVVLHPLPDSLKLHETENENDGEHNTVHKESNGGTSNVDEVKELNFQEFRALSIPKSHHRRTRQAG